MYRHFSRIANRLFSLWSTKRKKKYMSRENRNWFEASDARALERTMHSFRNQRRNNRSRREQRQQRRRQEGCKTDKKKRQSRFVDYNIEHLLLCPTKWLELPIIELCFVCDFAFLCR